MALGHDLVTAFIQDLVGPVTFPISFPSHRPRMHPAVLHYFRRQTKPEDYTSAPRVRLLPLPRMMVYLLVRGVMNPVMGFPALAVLCRVLDAVPDIAAAEEPPQRNHD